MSVDVWHSWSAALDARISTGSLNCACPGFGSTAIPPYFQSVQRLLSETPVTRVLVLVNALLFVALVVAGGDALHVPSVVLIGWGGNDGAMTPGEPWRLLSAVFLHGGLLHICLNMLALYQAGQLVERMYGAPRYLSVYLVSGVLASLASVWWRQDVVSIGASGAIFGVFGALLSFLVVHRRRMPQGVYSRMRTMTLSFVGYSLLLGFAIPGVDNAAHLGGLAAGLVVGWLLCLPPTRGALRLVGLLAVAGIAVLAWRDIEPPPQAGPAISAFAELQPLLAERQQQIMAEMAAGHLSQGEVLKLVETELKPNWDHLIAELSAHADRGDPAARPLLEYAQLERSSLEALGLGLRTGHPGWLATAASLRVDANRALQAYVRAHPPRGLAPGS